MQRKCALCLLIALAALAAPIAALADSPPQPIPADGKCAVAPDPNWTKQEQFVWLNVCVGKEADFNKELDYGGDFDPKSSKGLPDNRILRSSFLETILLKDKYRNALTRLGVRITGARFTEVVDLRNAELQHDLWLDRSLLERGANLESLRTGRRITLDGSKIADIFNASRSQIDVDLSMHQAEFSSNISLSSAHIGSLLDLDSSTVVGEINMNGIRVDHVLSIENNAHLRNIDLRGARIGGSLNLDGSTINGMLNMDHIQVGQSLFMRKNAQFKDIDLTLAHINTNLELDSSKVAGMLDMDQIHVEQSLFMGHKAQFNEINLTTAHIGGAVALDGATVTGTLNMLGIDVGQALLMHGNAQFEKVSLVGAHVGEQLILSSSTVNGMLDMDQIHIGKSLLMRDKAQFTDVDLGGAQIGGQVDLNSSTVTNRLRMNQIHVDQDVLLRNKTQLKNIDLEVAHIGGILDFRNSDVADKVDCYYMEVEQAVYFGEGAIFADKIDLTSAKLRQDLDFSDGNFGGGIDLTGAQIGGDLRLKAVRWSDTAKLNLANASAGRIDLSDNWPAKIALNGFTYRSLSKPDAPDQAEGWLRKQAYSPQPYEQLSSILQANGLIDDATGVRYAGKEQERQAAMGFRRVWLFLLKYSIGFGYHLEYAFAWALGFVLLGWAVLYATGQRTKHGTTLGLTYSFDILLPLVQLNKKHYDIHLDPWPQRYFYAHKIIGVILTSFIVAGISGLTK